MNEMKLQKEILKNPNYETLFEWSTKHVLHFTFHWPIIIKDGDGIILHDIAGKKYIDFGSQANTVNVGYGNKKIIEAAKEQLEKFSQPTFSSLNVPQLQLAKFLSEITPPSLIKSYFALSGAAAVETAIKTARKYTSKLKIIARWGSFHGMSYGAHSATGDLGGRRDQPQLPGFLHASPPYCYRCDFNLEYPNCNLLCARIIEKVIINEDSNTIAGVLMDPIMGGGGVVLPPNGYLPEVQRICNEYDIPLIFDEIYTGFGRTGKMFSFEHYNATPDILALGKAITSGYAALSAVVVKEKIASSDLKDAHIQYSLENNPLACAIALANIQVIIEDRLVDNAANVGEYFMGCLNDLAKEESVIGEVRGKGLLWGVEIVEDQKSKKQAPELARAIQKNCLEKGLIISMSTDRLNHATVILLKPPLVVKEEEVDEAMGIFSSAVKQASKQLA